MQHETICVLALQCIDFLLITRGAQRGNHQRLGFTTGEQRRTVRARQHAGANGDRAHGTGIAAINAGLAFRIWPRTILASRCLENVLDLVDRVRYPYLRSAVRPIHDCGSHRFVLVAVLFLADLVSFVQIGFGQFEQFWRSAPASFSGGFQSHGVSRHFIGHFVDQR